MWEVQQHFSVFFLQYEKTFDIFVTETSTDRRRYTGAICASCTGGPKNTVISVRVLAHDLPIFSYPYFLFYCPPRGGGGTHPRKVWVGDLWVEKLKLYLTTKSSAVYGPMGSKLGREVWYGHGKDLAGPVSMETKVLPC